MADEKKKIEDMTFREAMEELNSIVQGLEGNTLELEDSLKAYERGVTLIASLHKRLSEAELKVTSLMGELSEDPDDVTRDTTLS
ncbi:MAG: exodeoxyribonuclease VII small subunit [Eggerthellaceae bacterium]|jgi:exodeoxyribonuclease VII small subunit